MRLREWRQQTVEIEASWVATAVESSARFFKPSMPPEFRAVKLDVAELNAVVSSATRGATAVVLDKESGLRAPIDKCQIL